MALRDGHLDPARGQFLLDRFDDVGSICPGVSSEPEELSIRPRGHEHVRAQSLQLFWCGIDHAAILP